MLLRGVGVAGGDAAVDLLRPGGDRLLDLEVEEMSKSWKRQKKNLKNFTV